MSETATQNPTNFSSILDNNKSEMSRINEYRDKKVTATPRNLAFAGMSVFGLLLFIVFATQIITGVLAIILTAATAAGGFFGLRFLKAMDPLIQQKTKNAKLKWMVEEARKNATIQLDNQVLANKGRLINARIARDKMGALVEQLRAKINPANKGTPNYEKKTQLLKRVQASYEMMCDNLEKAGAKNEEFKVKVAEYKDMDAFATLAGEAMSFMGADGNKELEQMLSLESFNQIEGNFHQAIISIENSAADYAVDNM